MFALFCPIHHYNGLLHWRSPQQQPWLRTHKSHERSINTQMSNCWITTTLYKHQARHCISLRSRSFFASSSNVLAHKRPFYTLGARGFSCAVSGFGQVLKSDPRSRFSLRPSAEHVSACGRRNEAPRRTGKKPLVPRVTLPRFFANFEKDQWANIHGHCWKQGLEIS